MNPEYFHKSQPQYFLRKSLRKLPLWVLLSSLFFLQLPISSAQNQEPQSQDHEMLLQLVDTVFNSLYNDSGTALSTGLRAESLAKQSNDSVALGWIYSALGVCYWYYGKQLDSSLYYTNLSEVIADRMEIDDLKARSIGFKGLVYQRVGDYQRTLEYWRQAKPLYYALPDPNRTVVIDNNLGKGFLDLGELDSSAYYSFKALNFATQMGLDTLPITLVNIADLYFEKGKQSSHPNSTTFQEARKWAGVILSWPGAKRDLRSSCLAHRLLLRICLWEYEHHIISEIPPKCGLHAQQALEIAQQSENAKLLAEVSRTLANYHDLMGNHETGYKLLKTYTRLQDSLQNATFITRLNIQNYERERRESEKEINHLHQTNKLRLTSIIVLVVALILASLLAWSFYQRERFKNRANNVLKKKNEQIIQQAETLSQTANQLRESNYIRERLVALLAHDLRSPMANLGELLSMVQEKSISPEKFRDLLPALSDSFDYTSQMINSLLFWAEQQRKGIGENKQTISIARQVDQKIAHLSSRAAEKGVTLINQVPEDLTVTANPNVIDIIFNNLIGNAIKFCKKQDEIIVSGCTETPGEVILGVRDSGMGISQENLQKIIQQEGFSTPGTRNEKGVGLGLTLCQEFIAQMGGRFWVKSKLGAGSQVYFSIPIADPPQGSDIGENA